MAVVAGGTAAYASHIPCLKAGGEPAKSVSFFVAGVRFQQARKRRLSVGQPILVRASEFKGERGYSVTSEDGSLLGYVPKVMVSEVGALNLNTAQLTQVSYERVPWKRFRVTVSS
jgi:hypothetical protein